MLVARMCLHGVGRKAAIVAECRVVAGFEMYGEPIVEMPRPVGDGFVAAVAERTQIMHSPARAEDQHVLAAQWRKRAAQRNMMGRPEMRLDRNLRDRNVGGRIDQTQRDPRPVIEPLLRIGRRRNPRFAEQSHRLRGHIGGAGRCILKLVEFGREARKIVDRFGLRCARNGRCGCLPMRGRDQDCARARHRLPEPG